MSNPVEFQGRRWILVDGTTQITKTGNLISISRREATDTLKKLDRYLERNLPDEDRTRYEARKAFLEALLG